MAPAQRGEEAQRLRDYAEAAADWFWEMDAGLRFTRMSSSIAAARNLFEPVLHRPPH